eukprot:Opistho-2@75784
MQRRRLKSSTRLSVGGRLPSSADVVVCALSCSSVSLSFVCDNLSDSALSIHTNCAITFICMAWCTDMPRFALRMYVLLWGRVCVSACVFGAVYLRMPHVPPLN